MGFCGSMSSTLYTSGPRVRWSGYCINWGLFRPPRDVLNRASLGHRGQAAVGAGD